METEYLTAFYKETTDEIRRLREEQWKLSYYFVVEGMGVIYLFADGKVSQYINRWILLVLVCLQIGCIAIYLFHLHKNHTYIGRARNLRRKLEEHFGLHELRTPGGISVMPSEWKGPVSRWFEYNTVVAPLLLFVMIVQCASIYVVVVALSKM